MGVCCYFSRIRCLQRSEPGDYVGSFLRIEDEHWFAKTHDSQIYGYGSPQLWEEANFDSALEARVHQLVFVVPGPGARDVVGDLGDLGMEIQNHLGYVVSNDLKQGISHAVVKRSQSADGRICVFQGDQLQRFEEPYCALPPPLCVSGYLGRYRIYKFF